MMQLREATSSTYGDGADTKSQDCGWMDSEGGTSRSEQKMMRRGKPDRESVDM